MSRPIKELLELLKKNIQEDKNFYGMCTSTGEMRADKIITEDEEVIIDDFTMDNIPKRAQKEGNECGYWWTTGVKAPRIRFINKLLKEM